jgi:hypothetical protein
LALDPQVYNAMSYYFGVTDLTTLGAEAAQAALQAAGALQPRAASALLDDILGTNVTLEQAIQAVQVGGHSPVLLPGAGAVGGRWLGWARRRRAAPMAWWPHGCHAWPPLLLGSVLRRRHSLRDLWRP